MATLKITNIKCEKPSSGVDSGLVGTLSGIAGGAVGVVGAAATVGTAGAAGPVAFAAAGAVISQTPALVNAISGWRGDPDNLFLSTSSSSSNAQAHKIWPSESHKDMNAGNEIQPNVSLDFSGQVKITFWEKDNFGGWFDSADDDLGNFYVSESDVGKGLQWRFVSNPDEGDLYTVVYEVTSGSTQKYTLNPGEFLTPGQFLKSANGQFQVTYQPDGNLVLYRTRDNKPLWASNTNGNPAWRFYMQGDGNLVVYKSSGQPVWTSKTDGKGNCQLIMQDDGNLVIYTSGHNPVWSTGTYGQY